jgi:hypothetical protein
MPDAWTKKDERQYEKIRRSSRQRGVKPDRAKEIAARTVNKHRRQSGRTPQKTTSGTGNPTKPLQERSRQELYNRARQLDIAGRSSMKKADLLKAIRRAS